MAQVARISGPLLAANLVRTQANLAFETDLLDLDCLRPPAQLGHRRSH